MLSKRGHILDQKKKKVSTNLTEYKLCQAIFSDHNYMNLKSNIDRKMGKTQTCGN